MVKSAVKKGTMLYSGQEKEHMYGVGMLMNNKTRNALLTWEPISERIITARFQGHHTKMTVIQAYAPTNQSKDENKEEFYTQLQSVLDKVPSHDLILLVGYFNAKISEE